MKQQYQGYRDWVLDEWELHGAPKEWPAQLEELYRRQPVYAIVERDRGRGLVAHRCLLRAAPDPGDPSPDAAASRRPAGRRLLLALLLEGRRRSRRRRSRTTSPPRRLAAEVRQVARCGTPGRGGRGGRWRAQSQRPASARVRLRALVPGAHRPSWRTLVGEREDARAVARRQRPGGLEALAGSPSLDRCHRGLSVVEPARRGGRPAAGSARRARAVAGPSVRRPRTSSTSTRRGRSLWMKANGITARGPSRRRERASSPSCSPPTP